MSRYLPPAAIISINNSDTLIDQAEQQERFAATESSLDETGGRERFWRIGAALRIVAMLHADDPGLLAAYCEAVDRERAEARR